MSKQRLTVAGTLLCTVFACQFAAAQVSDEVLKSISTPDSVETPIGTLEFFDGVPTDSTVQTVYDTQTRSQLQTGQKFPTVGSQSKGFQQNADGSYDVFFGPKPPTGKESNWLETVPGKSWFAILRMYGPLEPWINKTWRPSEIELVK